MEFIILIENFSIAAQIQLQASEYANGETAKVVSEKVADEEYIYYTTLISHHCL